MWLICVQKSTGKILEMQSDATAGTLVANAVAQGYSSGDVEEQTVTAAEYAAMTLAQRTPLQVAQAARAVAIAAGFTITSTGTPAVNGTYALTLAQQTNLANVALYIAVNQRFPGGQTSLSLTTTTGALVQITSTTLWQAIATAVADYIVQLNVAEETAAAGGTASWPSATATIP